MSSSWHRSGSYRVAADETHSSLELRPSSGGGSIHSQRSSGGVGPSGDHDSPREHVVDVGRMGSEHAVRSYIYVLIYPATTSCMMLLMSGFKAASCSML